MRKRALRLFCSAGDPFLTFSVRGPMMRAVRECVCAQPAPRGRRRPRPPGARAPGGPTRRGGATFVYITL